MGSEPIVKRNPKGPISAVRVSELIILTNTIDLIFGILTSCFLPLLDKALNLINIINVNVCEDVCASTDRDET